MNEISKTELQDIIKNLSNDKASGPDRIYGELMKDLPDIAIEYLTTNFNNILKTKQIPDNWKTSTIYTIFKSGNPDCGTFEPLR